MRTRKNDQAWVEQKNGAIVRRIVGYGRFEGMAAAAVLASALRRGAVADQPVPTLLQAAQKDARRCQSRLVPACAGNIGQAGIGVGMNRCRECRAHRRSAKSLRSGGRLALDPRGAGRSGKEGRSQRNCAVSSWDARCCRPRRRRRQSEAERRTPGDSSPPLPTRQADPGAPVAVPTSSHRDRDMA